MGEIQALYLTDLSEICKTPISFAAWKPEEPKPEAVVTGKHVQGLGPLQSFLSLDQHKDPDYLAQAGGFKLGQMVYEKKTGCNPASNLFFITSIGKEVGLAQVITYAGEQMMCKVDLEKFLSHWVVYGSAPQFKMRGGQQRPTSLQSDEVRAKTLIKEGALVLLPIAPLNNFWFNKSHPAGVHLGQHDISCADEEEHMVDFYIHPMARPAMEEGKDTWEDEALVAAFWWVGTTDIKSQVNMRSTIITRKQVNIPVYTNTVDIIPGNRPMLYKAKAAPTGHLSTATVLAGDITQPKKKARSK